MSERLSGEPTNTGAVMTASQLRAGIDLIARLHHAHQQAVSHIDREMTDFDLSFTQWSTLWVLREGHAESAGDIARLLRLSSGATTRLIDSLEIRRLLQLSHSNSDRRVVLLSLTPQGNLLVTHSSSAIARAWQTLPSPF
ncbi:MarR family transcriptional regulator [Acetobacteraceae bacterium KSS8]|uniref:MarR family transcriptional regulator n=1 Tax=Endosaccharibacter trunci TaxID=2812733 RepID=A0ABT1WAA0_9PROT|nr:MarR family transcriptional regulator [Acetobacteraceae bacterium KSS8]